MKTLSQMIAASLLCALPGEKPEEPHPPDAWDDLYLDRGFYKVGFLTLAGDPVRWAGKQVEVTGYAKAMVGSGLELTVLPDEGSFFPDECKIGIGLGGNVESRRITEEIGRAGWAEVTVRGEFVPIGRGGLPPHLASLYNSSIQAIRFKKSADK